MRMLAIAFLATLLTMPLVRADETAEVMELVKSNIDIVIGLLRNREIDKNERNQKIIATINPFFDFRTMARVCLGETYWKPLSRAERKEFVALFVLRLQESYLEKLALYTDEEVVVEDATAVKKRIHVLTHLVTKDDKLEMVYKFYKSKRGWLVYDVVILGVSVVQTYRSQFSGFLKEASFADLMERLKTTGGFTIPTDDEGRPKAG